LKCSVVTSNVRFYQIDDDVVESGFVRDKKIFVLNSFLQQKPLFSLFSYFLTCLS
jgi:hypothetical protein